MIELGKIQSLKVLRLTPIGAYLNVPGGDDKEDILLPKNQLSAETQVGDEVEVFVYKDSEDRLISTLKKPKITLGELAVLKIAQVTKVGAFLDWGLEKDLLLPFKEQEGDLKTGDERLVTLYVDKSDRLCASMKIYELLENKAPYKMNERVSGTIYSYNEQLGFFVAVDNKYHGLLLNKELYGSFAIGDKLDARVKRVRPDGKLELSVREATPLAIEGDAQRILDFMKRSGGKTKLNDDSTPETIKAQLNMSKKAFKRAVGRLLKEGAIKISDEGMEMLWK
ncbi:MAG: S1-like domain-containing RNA-binding protein [Oscillospiraceae bacterium]